MAPVGGLHFRSEYLTDYPFLLHFIKIKGHQYSLNPRYVLFPLCILGYFPLLAECCGLSFGALRAPHNHWKLRAILSLSNQNIFQHSGESSRPHFAQLPRDVSCTYP